MTFSRPLSIFAAFALALGVSLPAVADVIPDPTDPTAQFTVTKEASTPGPVGPGDDFTYTISIGCSAISSVGCIDAITTDAVPAPLVIDNVVATAGNTSGDVATDGQDITVTWAQDLTPDVPGDDQVGLLDNTTAQVEITVHVPEDVPYDYNGQTLTNSATAEATNAIDVTDTADVTIEVPLDLETTATKTLDPTTALAGAGTDVTASLGGSNDSNATVDTLVIQDPVDPAADPNPFTYLGFTGFGDVTPPDTTDATTYEVYVDGAWVACDDAACDNVDPTEVEGTRVTFTGTFPPGASASVDLDLTTTDEAADLTEDTTVTNDVQSEVDLDDESATATDSADFNFQANDVEVTASKSFDPDVVVAGGSSTVTIGGANTSPFPIDSMTITEPSSGDFPDEYTFGGFGSGITYPEGATSGSVTFNYSDGTSETVDFADGEAPAVPAGHDDADVTSFELDFAGDIQPGAEAGASAAFDVDTDADLPNLPDTVNNEVAVDGENDGTTADDTADDDLYIYDEVIEPYVDKTIRPSQIVDVPGQVATITLAGGTTERPNPPDQPDGSTGDADHIVLQDPSSDPIEGDEFWNAFDVDSITATPIPADASLTIYYYDTTDDTWKVLTGPVAGPNAGFSYDIPADVSDVAGGIRFDYEYTGDGDGFPPGTDLEPNFTVSLRDDGRYTQPPYNTDPDDPDTILTNCAVTDASSPDPGVPSGTSDPGCDDIDIIPTNGQGEGDLIDKEFGTSSSGGNKSVIERSGDTIPSTLSWSTGGRTGFETVDVSDVADPEGTAIVDSVYDAFNLTRVAAITDAEDPFITYDQVTQVQLWDGTEWVDAANDPCPAACDGAFPGMDLTAAEQESTTGVRLTFAESPTRAATAAGDPDAPPVGSGVARSTGNARSLTLVWQIRDTKRSDGSPALAVDDYNQPDAGVVRNTANTTGYPQDGTDPVSDNDADDVVITDVPITSTTDKTWEGGPLAIPVPGTPAADYPSSRVTVTTTNTTPLKVDQLQITDTAPGSTATQDPFDYFNLSRFESIDVPAGATDTTVTITCTDTSENVFTRDEALALTPGTMACAGGTEVETVQVLFDGRILSNASGVLAMDLQLRETNRSTDAPITVDDAPIADTAQGVVADVDPIGACPPAPGDRYACDDGTDTIRLDNPTYDITADKSISPASQTEGDDSPVTVTIGEQSSGTARPAEEQLEDDDPTFWNAMDFVQMDPSWTLPAPVEHVQACYLSGGTFTDATVANDDPADVGGDWTCQPDPGPLPLPDDELTLQEAKDFIAAAPAGEIHGLRFLFIAGSEAGWQNPAHPLIQVPFQVQRRGDLRTGEPVPTTRSDQTPAPGEDSAGIVSDTVDVEGETVLVGAGGDGRLRASDSTPALYTYQHLTVGVEVDKSPSGQVQPGTTIPFTLTYTNTGEAALTNPVFTDVLPSDADGNQLIFDPDAAPGSSPYSFALAGDAPDPANGDPLPTDEGDITITEAGDTITFAMPDGTVLEPGQTYTITIELELRPGLTPDDVVTNTDVINVDEPFDEGACAPSYGPDAQHTDPVYDGACWDDTDVSPVRVAALSTIKKVKADVPVEEAGIPEIYLDPEFQGGLPDDYCDTAADADGFYRSPCVPVTYPGDTETWRYSITNTGTLPLDQVTSVDSLPHVGDTGVIVTLPRDSEWTPTFADSLELVDDAGTGADLTVLYSTSYNPCNELLTEPLGQPQAGDCEDADWLPYTADVDQSTVHSLATRLDFADGALFQPGDTLVFQAKTRTTPTDRADTTYPIAWNTVATGGIANDNGTRSQVPATEGRKVGVTYPVGPIQLEKTVSGPAAQYAPDSFTVQPTCTVDPDATDIGNIDPVELVPGDDPVQVDGLPWGATCTATETDQGQTTQTIGDATVGGPDDDIGLVSIDNVFDVGDMTVTKSVDSAAVDQAGNPITYGPFQVDVSCTFLGQDVYADGYDADNPMTFEIEDGQIVTLEDLPIGAECTTTEPDDADATGVVITPPTVTIGGDDKDPADVEAVTVTNTFDVGSLQLTKVVDGNVLENDPDLADGPFTLHVTCTLTDASHPDGEVVYDDDVTLTGVEPDNTATIDDIATGASCEVTETDDGGATESSVSPSPVTIGSGTTVEVTATNTFTGGSMTVTKAVDTDAVDQDGNPISYGPFQVDVACTFEGDDVYGTGFDADDPMTHTIDAGETWTINGLPIGAECTTTESDDADAVDVDISPASVVIGGDDADPADIEAVTVTNTYDVGSLQLIKEVTGDALANNPQIGAGPFRLRVNCTLTDASHDGETVYDDVVVLQGEQPLEATIDNLPTGAVCTVTEPGDGGATNVTFDPNPAQVEIGSEDANPIVTVTATNTFDAGDMAVTKSVESEAVDQDGEPIAYGPFQVRVTCTLDGKAVYATGYDADNPMIFTIEDGETVDLTDLPVGATCVTTEPDDADAADVAISPRTYTIVDNGEEDPVAVTVTNSYDTGSLRLRKFVPEAAQEYPISQGPFTLHVTCTLTDASHPDGTVVYDDDVILQGEQPLTAEIDNLATGSVCVVTEPDPGEATAHVIAPKSVTIGADTTVRVVVTNFFGAGSLTIAKTVDGPGADLYGAGPFEVGVTCTYTNVDGDQVPLNTPGGATRELSADNDYTATYAPLLLGSTCQVEETRTGGATSSVITDADGDEVSEVTIDSLTEALSLGITNTFDVGQVKVRKVVKGDGSGPYAVRLSCTYDVDGTTTKVDIPGGAERRLTAGNDLTALYQELPTGAACTLEETEDGGADSTVITPNAGDPSVGGVTVGDGTTVRLKVVNTFDDEGGTNVGPPGTGPGTGSGLPGTGSDLPVWAPWAGLMLVVVGGLLTLAGMRRRTA